MKEKRGETEKMCKVEVSDWKRRKPQSMVHWRGRLEERPVIGRGRLLVIVPTCSVCIC